MSHDYHVFNPLAPIFYSLMKSYLLTKEQLIENGYPQPTSKDGVASIKWDKDTPTIQPVGLNGTTQTIDNNS